MKEALILAGGFGTRLSHIISDLPKPMAPINGTPFLSFLLNKLIAARIEHVVLSTGYLHESIFSYFGSSYKGLQISYSKEDVPLFTGGAIALGAHKIESDSFLVLNGDTFFDIDFEVFAKFHTSKQTLLSIALRQVEDTSRFGSVIIDEQHKIINFTEKGNAVKAGLINGGIYIIDKTIFKKISLPEKFSFEKELLETWYHRFDFFGYPCCNYFIDIGIPEDYARAQYELPAFLES